MPIYEFACNDCGQEFESLQRLSDPLPDACPNCGKSSVQKKVSAAGFRLKGGGWYETDFKSGSKKNVSGTDADSSSAAGSGNSGSKEGSKGGSSSSDGSATKGSESAKSAASSANSKSSGSGAKSGANSGAKKD